MTATTVIGQRAKTSLEGRDPAAHGHPVLLADLADNLGTVHRPVVLEDVLSETTTGER